MRIVRVLSLLCLFLFTGVAVAEHQLRILKQNDSIKGELISIDDKNVVFKTAKDTLTKPLNQVLQIELQALPALSGVSYMQVELTDGTVLNCKPEGFVFKGKQVELTLLTDVKVVVPITALSFILKDAHEAKVRDNADWKKILKSRRNQDMLVKWFQGRLNGLGGTFTDGQNTSLNFLLEGRDSAIPLDIKHPTIQGCIFVNKPNPNAPVALGKLQDVQHNLLVVAGLEAKEGGDFLVTTVSGVKLQYRRDLVARLDTSWDKLTFLSDMAANVLQQPSEDIFDRNYRRDKNCDGNPLQLDGKRFPKGLFLPAPMKLAYQLGGEFNQFSAHIGIDDTVRGRSHVRLIIHGDGQELFAGEFKRADKRREVKLNIKDVQELRISVEPVEPLNLDGNHLDLADAKISK